MNHNVQDRISLELARCIASELCRRPEWICLARDNLERWGRRNSDSPSLLRCYAEWERILERPVEEVCTIFTAETHDGQRLRQNSPFAGALTPRAVWDIKRRIRHESIAA